MRHCILLLLILVFSGCANEPGAATEALADDSGRADSRPLAKNQSPFEITPVASFQEPWAMAFLPDERLLVTEKPGRLSIVTTDGRVTPVAGVPDVAYGGQGGLGDVALHPRFTDNRLVYLSYAEPGKGRPRDARRGDRWRCPPCRAGGHLAPGTEGYR